MAENASTVLFELKVPPLWPEKFGPGKKKKFGRDRLVVKKSFYFILFLSKMVAAAEFNSPSCNSSFPGFEEFSGLIRKL